MASKERHVVPVMPNDEFARVEAFSASDALRHEAYYYCDSGSSDVMPFQHVRERLEGYLRRLDSARVMAPNDVEVAAAFVAGLYDAFRMWATKNEPSDELSSDGTYTLKMVFRELPNVLDKFAYDDRVLGPSQELLSGRKDGPFAKIRDFVTITKPNIRGLIEGRLKNAAANAERLLEDWFALKGVPENSRRSLAAKFNQLAIVRPKWDDRHQFEHLSHLSAPRFLRAVYADVIDEKGRLTNEDVVRLSDPKLVRIMQGYITKRIDRMLPLGDAKGLVFSTKDGRGRPKKRSMKLRKHKETAPSV